MKMQNTYDKCGLLVDLKTIIMKKYDYGYYDHKFKNNITGIKY